MIAKRIGASVFDFIVLLSLVTLLPQFVINQENMTLVTAVGLLGFFALCVAHSFLFLASFSATPGKMLFGLRVSSVKGANLNLKQCFLRALFSIGGAWLLGPGMKASALLNEDRRHWYDLYLGTQVISKRTVTTAPAYSVHKRLGWALVVVVTGFFIVNHALSLKNLSFENGHIIYSQR